MENYKFLFIVSKIINVISYQLPIPIVPTDISFIYDEINSFC